MAIRKATIRNAHGIHCRPSAIIINECRPYAGTVMLSADGKGEITISSLLDLLSLGLQEGEPITITVDGPDDEQMADKMLELFERHFDFPPRGDA